MSKLGILAVLISISQSAEILDNIPKDDLVVLLAKRMDAFEATNEALSDENENLKTRIKALEALAMKQQRKIEKQTANNKRLEERLAKLEGSDKSESNDRRQYNRSMAKGICSSVHPC